MRANDGTRTGGEILVDQLVVHGVQHVFCVPGESYLAALDAFYDRPIKLTVCRQEGGATMMAEAVGKATGRPGICFVTRGPGATNASPGIHIARQDSTPMIVFVGQVAREMREREAFQELDYRAVFGSHGEMGDRDRRSRAHPGDRVARLLHRLQRPAGPGGGRAARGHAGRARRGARRAGLRAGRDLARPGRHGAPAEAAVGREAADRAGRAAAAGRRRRALRSRASPSASRCRSRPPSAARHLFDTLHPSYAGDVGLGINPKLLARIKAADLIVLIGGRLGEMPSQSYSLFDIPGPRQTFVHVHPGAEELGRVYHPHLAINAAPTASPPRSKACSRRTTSPGAQETKTAHADYLAWTEKATPQPGGVNFGEIMVWLRENLPADAIITNGAGNFSAWVHRFYRFRQVRHAHRADARARWATACRRRSE